MLFLWLINLLIGTLWECCCFYWTIGLVVVMWRLWGEEPADMMLSADYPVHQTPGHGQKKAQVWVL